MTRLKVVRTKLPNDRHYPVGDPDLTILALLSSPAIANRITTITFKDNQRSTKEASVRWNGNALSIEINFCLDGLQSRLLAPKNKRYNSLIERIGGLIDRESKLVTWTKATATRYTYFLFAHELAHVRYVEERSLDLSDFCSSAKEERWCDDFALKRVEQLVKTGVL